MVIISFISPYGLPHVSYYMNRTEPHREMCVPQNTDYSPCACYVEYRIFSLRKVNTVVSAVDF